jgi:ligand-binding sensor domain-containing protein
MTKDNILWIGTEEGLCSFDSSTGKFSRYTQAIDGLIKVMYEDSRGNLWIGTNMGIYLFNIDNLELTLMMENITVTNSKHRFVSCIYEDSNHLLWFGTSFGLYCYNLEDKTFITHGFEDEIVALNKWVLDIIEDDRGYLWWLLSKD